MLGWEYRSDLNGSLPFRPENIKTAGKWLGWALVVWVVVFWRLGYPSFWDPGDEAHYAQATREMLASGHWLVPTYEGAPFFDKPILFYVFQLVAFAALGPTELAARLVPALSAVGLFGGMWWVGRRLFDRTTASIGTLMLAVLPATFALSSYAILDMTFTAFLFTGLGLVAVAAVRARPRLEMPGYVLIALAVLTKGPLAIALAGLTLGLVLLIAPEARRPLLRSHWIRGLALVTVISAPWFVYMWWRFDRAFIEGYWLRENFWLYTHGLVGEPLSALLSTFYLRILAAGLLPWTPVLIGRLVDVARGDRCTTEERMLWAWSAVVVAFFSLSRFKLDHYVYPVAPALALLAAHAWQRLRSAPTLRPNLGTAIGVIASAIALIAGGLALAPVVRGVPMTLGWSLDLIPASLIASGAWLGARTAWRRLRPPAAPIGVAAAFLTIYAVIILSALPEFERAKPVKDLGQWAAATVAASERVGAYRMDRWNTSWRFYVDRAVDVMDTPEQLEQFLAGDGRHFCLMMQRDFDDLVAAGYPLTIVREAPGLFVTTGRALTRGSTLWQTFVIVSDAR
jgi:4-amino-4-deoxy-L-arabinose transferase-like glycosyltransferase